MSNFFLGIAFGALLWMVMERPTHLSLAVFVIAIALQVITAVASFLCRNYKVMRR